MSVYLQELKMNTKPHFMWENNSQIILYVLTIITINTNTLGPKKVQPPSGSWQKEPNCSGIFLERDKEGGHSQWWSSYWLYRQSMDQHFNQAPGYWTSQARRHLVIITYENMKKESWKAPPVQNTSHGCTAHHYQWLRRWTSPMGACSSLSPRWQSSSEEESRRWGNLSCHNHAVECSPVQSCCF